MLKIRKAAKKDNPQILKLLKEVDLYYQGLELKNFWVAEKDEKIIGTVQLTDHKKFVFLGSLSVSQDEQGKGVGSCLLNIAIKDTLKPIYLYTVIPDFFKKHGFTTTDPIPHLPSKDRYQCEYCFADKCVTMVKLPDAA
jgi:N-acetylglutamate synthase-like GNAT family acetyltransferase